MEELSLVQQGYYHLQLGAFAEAKECFEKALTEEKDLAEAHIGALLAEYNFRSEDQLSDVPVRLNDCFHFRRAKECASEGYLKTLSDHERRQIDVLRLKEEKYRRLLEGREKNEHSEEELTDLIGTAIELRQYKNAPELRAGYEEQLEALRGRQQAEKKKKLAVVIPIVAVAGMLLIVLFALFAFPKKDGISYALTLNGYSVASVDKSLESVKIPEKINGVAVTSIGKKAFKDCAELKKVELNGRIGMIDEKAFSGCKKLEALSFSESVESVKKKAFDDCVSLEELHFNEKLRYAKTAFEGCEKLKVYAGGHEQNISPDDE